MSDLIPASEAESASPVVTPFTGGDDNVTDLDQSQEEMSQHTFTKVNKATTFAQAKGVIITTPSRSSEAVQSRNPRTPASAKASTSFATVAQDEGPTPKSDGPAVPVSSSSSFNSSFKQKQRRYTAPAAATSRGGFKKGVASGGSVGRNQTMRKENRPHWKPPPAKGKRYGGRRTSSGYTLKTKDSLVDVTACLQAKREEVMKLWQSNLQQGDPALLSKIEVTNRLALEAAEEVEFLRRTIQDFQKKEGGLSDADCQCLEDMRSKVLDKVKEFEEADKTLQESMSKKSLSRSSLLSVSSKKSQTDHEGQSSGVVQPPEMQAETVSGFPGLPGVSSSRHNEKDLVFLKERPDIFNEESGEDDTLPMQRQPFSDKSTVASVGTSAENLSRLKLLYEENFAFPSFSSVVPSLGRSQSCNFSAARGNQKREQLPPQSSKNTTPQAQPTRTVRFHEFEASEESIPLEELYREKITYLQRKLMDTEQEVEELKSEIERIESDASFRVRMLQNSVQDKFDSLKAVPEYLEMVDFKLTESVQVKAQLLREVQEKQAMLQEEVALNKNLKKEINEFREKLRTAENTKDFLSFKNAELEKNNLQLRNEMEHITKQIADMATQIQLLKANETGCGSNYTSPRSPRLSYENHKLKLQVSELKDQLSQSKRIIQTLRKSKTKLTSDLNDRIEELMDSLQQAQHHKRVLGEQIRLLKKSYSDMFPGEFLLAESAMNVKKCGRQSFGKNHHRQRKPVQEPKIEAKAAWQTGDNIKLDNLLELKLPTRTHSKTHVSFGGEQEIN